VKEPLDTASAPLTVIALASPMNVPPFTSMPPTVRL